MLTLSPKTLGAPHWREVQPGDLSTWQTQYLQISPVDPSQRRWRTVPFTLGTSYPRRLDATWREPVTTRAKIAATWAALPKIFPYIVGRFKRVYRKVFPET